MHSLGSANCPTAATPSSPAAAADISHPRSPTAYRRRCRNRQILWDAGIGVSATRIPPSKRAGYYFANGRHCARSISTPAKRRAASNRSLKASPRAGRTADMSRSKTKPSPAAPRPRSPSPPQPHRGDYHYFRSFNGFLIGRVQLSTDRYTCRCPSSTSAKRAARRNAMDQALTKRYEKRWWLPGNADVSATRAAVGTRWLLLRPSCRQTHLLAHHGRHRLCPRMERQDPQPPRSPPSATLAPPAKSWCSLT